MVNDYTRKIVSIHNLLISNNIIQKYVGKISQIDIDKYILDIGSILYHGGKTKGNYTLFPYHIFLKGGKEYYNSVNNSRVIFFKIAVTHGPEENSYNYKSNRPKDPVKIRKGVILIGRGEYLYNTDDIKLYENKIHFMVWNTSLKLQTLKDKVQWEPFLDPYLNDVPNNINKIYNDYFIFWDTHHIDNDAKNNRAGNILKVTWEQHAAIHLYMWNDYKIDKNEESKDYNCIIRQDYNQK
jgi:hypothetical protein